MIKPILVQLALIGSAMGDLTLCYSFKSVFGLKLKVI